MNGTFDYKKRCEELTAKCLNLDLENQRLKRDNQWIRQVLAFALQNSPTLVVREDDLQHAPEIELAENMANEMIIRVRRTAK